MVLSGGPIFTFRRWPERIKMGSLSSTLGKLLLRGGKGGTDLLSLSQMDSKWQ